MDIELVAETEGVTNQFVPLDHNHLEHLYRGYQLKTERTLNMVMWEGSVMAH